VPEVSYEEIISAITGATDNVVVRRAERLMEAEESTERSPEA
jgi:D-xylose transport system ATP-binding protein